MLMDPLQTDTRNAPACTDEADGRGSMDVSRSEQSAVERWTRVRLKTGLRISVPLPLIERTFAEARRFHALPMDKKRALKLNEHNNGYMVMGRYAVRTSQLNNNDKGDLNEAFFVKRERPADDPLLLSGRRFVGPNQWPADSDLPGFRA